MRLFRHDRVWTRGIFVNEYGLDSSKVTWVVDDEEHVTSLKLPPNVVHAPDGKSLASMMASGELQAGFSGPAGIGRAGPPTGAWEQRDQASTVTYPELIADVPDVEAQWFRDTGIYPIHGLIVEDEHSKHPWLARSLMRLRGEKSRISSTQGGEGDSPEDKRYRNFLSLMSDPLFYGMAEPPQHRSPGHLWPAAGLIPSRPE